MALVTDEPCVLGPNMARFYVTYDDGTFRISSIRIENDYTFAVTVTATNPGSSQVLTFTAAGGQYGTYTLANNERYFYNQWSFSLGAA